MIKTHNDNVATTPFVETATRVDVNRGVPGFKQRQQLAELTVVYDSVDGRFKAGDKVYFLGDMAKHQLALQVWTVEEGKPFILLPINQVKLSMSNA